jgi:hypothetical protein
MMMMMTLCGSYGEGENHWMLCEHLKSSCMDQEHGHISVRKQVMCGTGTVINEFHGWGDEVGGDAPAQQGIESAMVLTAALVSSPSLLMMHLQHFCDPASPSEQLLD